MALRSIDLMIGDWVKSRGKIEQVTSVYDGYICTDSFEDSHDYYFDPIPITAEILEKNGIKLKEVGDNGISTPPEWRNRFEKWVLRTQWKDTFIWYDRTAKYWHLYDNMGAAKLLYVHELQHALRLCGIEKEIVL